MIALLFIFAMAWFIGWAVMLGRNPYRKIIDSAANNKEKAKGVATMFVIWPLAVLANWVSP